MSELTDRKYAQLEGLLSTLRLRAAEAGEKARFKPGLPSAATGQHFGYEAVAGLVERSLGERRASEPMQDLLNQIRDRAFNPARWPHALNGIGEQDAYRGAESLIRQELAPATEKTRGRADENSPRHTGAVEAGVTNRGFEPQQVCSRAAREYGLPVHRVPEGTPVTGKLVGIWESSAQDKGWAVVVGESATHVVSVPWSAKSLLGRGNVRLERDAKVVRVSLEGRSATLTRDSIGDAAARQHGRPVLGNHPGVQGRLDRIVADAAGQSWGVVVAQRSVHIVRATQADRRNVGQLVAIGGTQHKAQMRVLPGVER